ncbi:glycosyltransferase family 29 protein [Pseudoscourfieldia marina]
MLVLQRAVLVIITLAALERWRALFMTPPSLESMASTGKYKNARRGAQFSSILPPGKQRVFYPLVVRKTQIARTLYDLGSANILLHKRQFDSEGAPGDVADGTRAYVTYTLLSSNGDGAKRYGHALEKFEVSKSQLGEYFYPPSLVQTLPADDARWRFESCAVVGNSGKLLFGRRREDDGQVEHFGREIDEHGAVFRINGAPTRGFEKYVGARTTFDVSNHLNLHRLSLKAGRRTWTRSRGARMVVFESTSYQQYFHGWDRLVARFSGQLLVLAPDLVAAHYELWCRLVERALPGAPPENGKPTSGWFAAAMASQVCDSVTLYGFDAWDAPEGHEASATASKRGHRRRHGGGGAYSASHGDADAVDWAAEDASTPSGGIASSANVHDVMQSASKDDAHLYPYHYWEVAVGQSDVHSFPLLVRVFKLLIEDGFPIKFT